MENQPSFDEIASFFRHYQATFEQLEPQAIARLWCAPTLALEPGRVKLCLDDDALQEAFQTATAQLQQAGLRRTEFVLDEVRILHEDLVDCIVQWDLRDAAGTTFKRLNNIYVLRRYEQRWGVAAVYLLPTDSPPIRLTNLN